MDPSGIPAARRPGRLGDPLLSLRNLIVGLVVLVAVHRLTPTVFEQPGGWGLLRQIHDAYTIASVTALFLAILLAPVLLVLPHRRTNAYFLRAFANDEATGELRLALQRALGRRFRLSGIRDPQRRMSLFLRSVTVFLFCFRYSTVRYMNLEAGSDWLPRLARSLDDARCVFIDLTRMTGPLDDELHLAVGRVGLARLMFLSSAAPDAGALRDLVGEKLGIDAAARGSLHAAVWPREAGRARQAFHAEVGRFVAQLPAGAARTGPFAGSAPEGFPPFAPETRLTRWRSALTEYAGLAFIPVCLSLYQYGFWATLAIGNANPSKLTREMVAVGVPVFHGVMLVFVVYAIYAIVRYFIECGSTAGRVKSAAILAFYVGLPLSAFLASRV